MKRTAIIFLLSMAGLPLSFGQQSATPKTSDEGSQAPASGKTSHSARRNRRSKAQNSSTPSNSKGQDATVVPLDPNHPMNPDPMRPKNLPVPPKTPVDPTNPVRPTDPTSPTTVKPPQ